MENNTKWQSEGTSVFKLYDTGHVERTPSGGLQPALRNDFYFQVQDQNVAHSSDPCEREKAVASHVAALLRSFPDIGTSSIQHFAKLIQDTLRVNQESFDREAADKATAEHQDAMAESKFLIGPDYSKFYKISLAVAALQVCEAADMSNMAYPVYLLLQMCPNDIIDWADATIKDSATNYLQDGVIANESIEKDLRKMDYMIDEQLAAMEEPAPKEESKLPKPIPKAAPDLEWSASMQPTRKEKSGEES